MKRFENYVLDTANECLWHGTVRIDLQPKIFAVLRHLVDNSGRLVTQQELLETLWPQTYVQPQVLRTYILELRKIFGDDPNHPRFIRTLPKRGYCFLPAVACAERIPSASGICCVEQLLEDAFRAMIMRDDAHLETQWIRTALDIVRSLRTDAQAIAEKLTVS